MSENTQNSNIDNEDAQDDILEISLPDSSYDDEDDDGEEMNRRKPIDLDTPVDLADAVAAAGRMRAKESDTAKPPVVDTSAVDISEGAANTPHPKDYESLKTQLAQANENYLRALADLQNFRRRGEEERRRIVRDGNERLIKELLPVLDDFDLALAASKQAENNEQLASGVDAIVRKLQETLAKEGVHPIEAVGHKFDTDLHEAVMLDEDTDLPDETVSAELRKGYTLNDRVIRPALVKVAKNG